MKKLKVCFLVLGLLCIMSIVASAASSYAYVDARNGITVSEGSHVYMSKGDFEAESYSGSVYCGVYQVIEYWPDNCVSSTTLSSGGYTSMGSIKLNSSRQSYAYAAASSKNAEGYAQLY